MLNSNSLPQRRGNRFSVVAKRSLMVKTSGYKDIFSRSYMANINDTTIIDDFDYLVNENGSSLAPSALSHISGRIIAPQSVAGNKIYIDGGWDEERLAFLISVNIEDSMSMYPKTMILSGYTDICDISYNGNINPDTRLYINSVMTLNNTGRSARQVDASQIITHGHARGLGIRGDFNKSGSLITMRPQDVVTDIRLSHEDGYSINGSNMVTPYSVIKSHRTNNLPSRYVSGILTKVRSYSNQDMDDYTSLDMAASSLANDRLDDGYLLRRLKVYDTFTASGYITWDDLCYEIIDLDKETLVARGSSVNRSTPAPSDSEGWYGADNSTLAATMINQSLSSIMTMAMIIYLECEISNETIDGVPSVKIFDLRCFDEGMDVKQHASFLSTLIVDELVPLVSAGNTMDFTVNLTFDIMTNNYLNISIDGGDWVEYISPSFCDSLYSPVVTHDDHNLSNISRTFGELINKVSTPRQFDY